MSALKRKCLFASIFCNNNKMWTAKAKRSAAFLLQHHLLESAINVIGPRSRRSEFAAAARNA
jgi:hypothetical protein